jgi:hypothetical protein
MQFHGSANCASASLPPDGATVLNPYYVNIGIF